jgi:VWFA-related protein
MRKFFLASITVFCFVASAQAQTAGEILAKVSSVYAGCRTYSDEGVTSTTESRGRQSSFRTSFVRPGVIRFQLWFNSTEPGRVKPWTVWTNGELVQIHGIGSDAGTQHLRIDSALLRMGQFSDGSSVTVPQLLLADSFRTMQLFSVIAEARVAGEDNLDGRQSFRIEGAVNGLPIKLWIDKTQYVILKTYRKVMLGDSEIESTVDYKPKLNGDVPAEDLAPPQSLTQTAVDMADPKSVMRMPPPMMDPPKLRNFGSSLSSSQPMAGSSARRSEDDDVVRVDTNLVVCSVLVQDAQGKTVSGLSGKDFIVKEDDKAQDVATFSLGNDKELARQIVLVIDYSVSQAPYIKTSVESAKLLVDKLNPKDSMAIVTDDVHLLVDFTRDKQLLKTKLDGLKTSALSGIIGQSEQYDALLAALRELFNNEDLRPIIIFQTDGDQLELLNGSGAKPVLYWLPKKYSLEDVQAASAKTRAAVYSVISGIKFIDVPQADLARRAKQDWEDRQRTHAESLQARNMQTPIPNMRVPNDQFFDNYAQQWQRRQSALVSVAKASGTTPEFLEEPAQADQIYTRILSDIEQRYIIGYYPTNRARDGKRRKVNVEVRGHPEYTIWGQKSYFAREH